MPTNVELSQIDLEQAPEDLLRDLGKDSRLIPYGGGNFGMPLEGLEPDGPLIVPTAQFFLRCNGPIPVLDPATWTLTIGGHVAQSLILTLADLQAMPQRTLTAFLECAGNGRTRFDPLPPGTPWRNDAAGNAVWEGVSLWDVLDLVGIRDGAVDLLSQGGDFPAMQRGLPLSVARDPDTLLVLRMNGEPLSVGHGGPVRLLVPGWAGIASTKWLVGVEVIDHAFAGFWNSDNYVYLAADGTPLRPVTEMPVKSLISAPQDGAVLRPGTLHVTGYAWSGQGAIAQVDVSVDGGARWEPAELEQPGRRSWARFSYPWQARPGRHTILARATDERRLTQPQTAAWNGKGYGQNGIHQLIVTVSEPLSPNGADPLALEKARAAATYNTASDYYDHPANSFWDRFGARTVERLALKPGQRVLDVCCGAGGSAIPAAIAVGPHGSVIGVDLADNLLSLARAKAVQRRLEHVEFRRQGRHARPCPGGPAV